MTGRSESASTSRLVRVCSTARVSSAALRNYQASGTPITGDPVRDMRLEAATGKAPLPSVKEGA